AVHHIVEHIARSLDTETRDRAGIAAGVNHPVASHDDAVTHHNYSVHLVLRQHVVLDEVPVSRDHGVDADAVVKCQDRAVAHRDVGKALGKDAHAIGVGSGWTIADLEPVAVDRNVAVLYLDGVNAGCAGAQVMPQAPSTLCGDRRGHSV